MSIDRGKNTGFVLTGVPLLLTILFVCKMFFENVTHADSEVQMIGILSFSLFELIWLSFPYVIMLHFFNKHVAKIEKIYLDYVVMCIVSGIGLIMCLNIRLVHPDAQGPIAIQIIPLVQFGIYALLSAFINSMRNVQARANENDKTVCQNCGTVSTANAIFCRKCGAKIKTD